MTRETKIGLLVGLAFIIVIGILLEDHFSGLQEPKPAALGDVGRNVRSGAGIPASNRASMAQPADGSLRNPVPTTRDLTRQAIAREINSGAHERGPGEARVSIGPGGGGAAERRAETINVRPGEAELPLTERRGESPIERVARALGEELVRPGERGGNSTGGNSTGNGGTAAPAAMKQHKAEAGDTLSKLAGRFMGGNSKANRDAIVRANPSLQENPDRVVVGRMYNIPSSAAALTPPTTAPTVVRAPEPTRTPAEQVYTTKQGDTLWRIAVEQCGAASARTQILELNQGVITDPNRLPVNTKIKLPPRTVASAR